MRSPLFAVKRADHAKPNWRGVRVWLLSLRTAKGIFGIVSAALSLASKFRFLGNGDSVRRLGSNVLTAAEDLIAVSSRARRFNDLALMA
jgi:hypothetical protein